MGKFGDEDLTDNDYIVKLFASLGDDFTVEEFAQKTSGIDKNFIDRLKELFTTNPIKYNLMLDILMAMGYSLITDTANENKAVKFLSDICMLLEVEGDMFELVMELATYFADLEDDTSPSCVDILNQLCETIDYNRYFKCYIKEYNIQEVFIKEEPHKVSIETIKGAEMVFNANDYLNKTFCFKNVRFDVAKCNLVFNSQVDFYDCEFYSSSILTKDAITLNGFNSTSGFDYFNFVNCKFHDISFAISQELSLVRSDSKIGVHLGEHFNNCSFNNITDFDILIAVYGFHQVAVYFESTNLNNIEGSQLCDFIDTDGYQEVHVKNTMMSNAILDQLIGHLLYSSKNEKEAYVRLDMDSKSKLDYIEPKDKDLTSSILSNLS